MRRGAGSLRGRGVGRGTGERGGRGGRGRGASGEPLLRPGRGAGVAEWAKSHRYTESRGARVRHGEKSFLRRQDRLRGPSSYLRLGFV